MKLLILSSYSFSIPFNGGQVRALNLKKFYEANGAKVCTSGILSSDDFFVEDGYLKKPKKSELCKIGIPYEGFEDYIVGYLASNNMKFFKKLFNKISINPDFIQVEHPWFFDFAVKIKKNFFFNAKIIYSSHNNEYKLKKKLFFNKNQQSILHDIQLLELRAIRKSDYVISVSKENKRFNDKHSKLPSILVENGADEIRYPEFIDPKFKKIIPAKFALFYASSYNPNIEGFFHFFTEHFGSIPPNCYLVLAGEISYEILKDRRLKKLSYLLDKTIFLGRISRYELNYVIEKSHCILLPILVGEGSSLKTAEAILSCKYVITSSVSMRGYESYKNSKGIFVTDSPIFFKKTLFEVLMKKSLKLAKRDINERNKLLWTNTLQELKDILIEP